MTDLQITLAAGQILGQRSRQEDAFRVVQLPEENTIVCVLADGMGGHAGGDVAANLVVKVFADEILSKDLPYHRQFANILDRANRAIENRIETDPALFGMGSTLVCAEIINDQIYWVSVGDSLLLHASNSEVKRLNADHSIAARLDKAAERGDITWEEAKNSKSRNALLSALTGEPISRVDISRMPVQLKHGDFLLLASDGIETLNQAEILEILAANTNEQPDLIIPEILESIERKQRGNQDNATIILLSCHSDVIDPDKITTRPIINRN